MLREKIIVFPWRIKGQQGLSNSNINPKFLLVNHGYSIDVKMSACQTYTGPFSKILFCQRQLHEICCGIARKIGQKPFVTFLKSLKYMCHQFVQMFAFILMANILGEFWKCGHMNHFYQLYHCEGQLSLGGGHISDLENSVLIVQA